MLVLCFEKPEIIKYSIRDSRICLKRIL